MAKVCYICGKGPQVGYNVSHSNRKTKRRWLPNLHRTKIMINKTAKHVYLCTTCLRTKKQPSLQTA
ncbi:MAG: 50S ribosomal protein L28 [bacterium]